MQKTTICLSPHSLARLDEMAKRRGQPKAELIRRAVDTLIAEDEPTLPSWFGIAESSPDDGYDSSNIRDWIRKTWRPE